MTADRRTHPRPYFFELFAAVNLAGIYLLGGGVRSHLLVTFPGTVIQLFLVLMGYAIVGVVLRSIAAAVQGTLRAYVAAITTRGWLSDTFRLLLFAGVLTHAYAWVKLLVPVLHPVLYDQQLWDLDQALLFGLSPNILFISLFDHPAVMATVDWSYARIFLVSMMVAFGFFLSHPARRLRVAFSDGNTSMWLIGAWLYMLVPSVGPAYRFPELWIPLAPLLPLTHEVQAMLMRNYQNMLRFATGQPVDVRILFGVAAFPSLHVAFQTYAFLWMRRLWIYGQIVFGVFVLTIFIGSIVTGWHYLIDSVAGILLAAACYWIAARAWRVPRWLRLRQALRGRR